VTKSALVAVLLSTLQSYVGNYTATLDGQALQINVCLAGNTLLLKTVALGTGASADLFPTAADTFAFKDNTIINGTVVFSKDSSDRRIATIYTPEGATVVATRQ
jgi:hypothetical protein